MAHFLIYGKDGCGYCEKAKTFLDNRSISYTYRDVNSPGIKNELLRKYPEAATVPQIFEILLDGDEIHVGGYDKLSSYLN